MYNLGANVFDIIFYVIAFVPFFYIWYKPEDRESEFSIFLTFFQSFDILGAYVFNIAQFLVHLFFLLLQVSKLNGMMEHDYVALLSLRMVKDIAFGIFLDFLFGMIIQYGVVQIMDSDM